MILWTEIGGKGLDGADGTLNIKISFIMTFDGLGFEGSMPNIVITIIFQCWKESSIHPDSELEE
jgi:hypothetical protein